MIQVREQYGNLYIRILDTKQTFDLTLDRIRRIPQKCFKQDTGEWMIPKEELGNLLQNFENQIVWMQPLREISQNLNIDHELIQKHLSWESNDEFKRFLLSPYPYQKVGAHFLADRGRAAIYDGVGLGKTCQLLGACQILFNQKKAKRAIIVTLNSLKRQWVREIEKFTGLSAVAIDGSSAKKEKLLKEFKKDKKLKYMVVNYELLRNKQYLKLIKEIKFDIIALDEAQKIKSGVTDKYLNIEPSQNAAACYELRKDIPYRFIATATPVQGKAEEAYSLFTFLDEDILGSWEYFRERYCKYHPRYGITGNVNLGEMYWRISPHFIRRTKEMPEIQQQLPEVQHSHVFLDMTEKQRQVHDYLLGKIEEYKEMSRNFNFLPVFMRNWNPDQIKEFCDQMIQGFQTFLLAVCDSLELLDMSDSQMAQQILKECSITPKDYKSPKLEQMAEFYQEVCRDEPSSKFVIFTKFERMAQLIHKALPNSVMFHGGMGGQEKDEAVEQIKNDPHTRAIIMTEAGSTGLNLQFCNYMLHADIPWDPTLLEQRNGRIDRTGSSFKNVGIYYYVMNDSFDEHLLTLLDKKADLASQILEGGGRDTLSRGKKDLNSLAVDRMLRNKQKRGKAVNS